MTQKHQRTTKLERKNFTESYINKLPNADITNKRYEVYDEKIKELSCRITNKGKKSFYIRKKFNGKAIRVHLGDYPVMTVENARKSAQNNLNLIASDKNPNIEKKRLAKTTTLKELFNKYTENHAKIHTKPRTYQENLGVYNRYLKKWENRIVNSFNKGEIEEYIISLYKEKGKFVANSSLVLLRHIFNKGIEWGLEITNPTLGIKKYAIKSRERFLSSDEIGRFISAANNYHDSIVGSYFLLSLFTGQRRTNVLSMRWDCIDFTNAIWHIPETKNGEPLNVTLVTQALDILKKLQKTSTSEWVFPSKMSKSGHLEEPKYALKAILKTANITNFRIHDLRRTLGSYEAISGASLQIIGKSLGHKSTQATEIYARLSLDPVRNAAQTACNHMLELAKDNKEKDE